MASHATAPQEGRNAEDIIAFMAQAMAGLWEWIDSSDGASLAVADGGGGAPAANRAGNGGRNGREDANSGGNICGGAEEGKFLVLPLCNAFLRRGLYETIKDEYPSLVLERADSVANGGRAAGATARDQIRAIGLSPTEKEWREARLRQEAWDNMMLKELEFAMVFCMICNVCSGRTFDKGQTCNFLDVLCPDLSRPPPATPTGATMGRRIPLVVHNRLHDLIFLMTHCHNPALHDTFKGVKALIRTYPPLVFDTKVIGTEYSNA
jgi:hypothetical protein